MLLANPIIYSIDTVFLFLQILHSWWAREEAKKDLARSRVKKFGRDVVLSKKIVYSIILVPALWITYALLLYFFSPLETRTIIVLLLCCPLFSYLGVMSVQAGRFYCDICSIIFLHNSFIPVTGMVDLKDLRPVYYRLLPQFREVIKNLPQQRTDLQKELRNIVRKYGPGLGPLYFDEEVVWIICRFSLALSTKYSAFFSFSNHH